VNPIIPTEYPSLVVSLAHPLNPSANNPQQPSAKHDIFQKKPPALKGKK
jgi:hypothetical protein